MKKNPNNKLFIVKKYVWAKNARDAIRLENKQVADDVWVDEEWKKQPPIGGNMGFYTRENKKI